MTSLSLRPKDAPIFHLGFRSSRTAASGITGAFFHIGFNWNGYIFIGAVLA
jgi:hypothetical protein